MSDSVELLTLEQILPLFPPRDPLANKGSYGRALLLCGSYGMAGAAAIAAEGCVKSGVGLCEVLCPESIYPILAPVVREAVYTPVHAYDPDIVCDALRRADAVAMGCGLGATAQTAGLLQQVLEQCNVPLVIDADGLNCLSANIEWLQQSSCPVILTPHPGEMARLCGCDIPTVQQHRISVATQLATCYHVTVVLKGHDTLIACPNGSTWVNPTGNPGMATGGSGDLLCGMIAAFLAQGTPPTDAAKAGVYLHGLAGDLCAAEYSQISTTPTGMLQVLPRIFREIENNNQ